MTEWQRAKFGTDVYEWSGPHTDPDIVDQVDEEFVNEHAGFVLIDIEQDEHMVMGWDEFNDEFVVLPDEEEKKGLIERTLDRIVRWWMS